MSGSHHEVYCVTNMLNGKRYLGKTHRPLRRRWQLHLVRSRQSGTTEPFANALRLYGAEVFELKTLVIVSSNQEACFYERALIMAFNSRVPNGYNLTAGGDGGAGQKKGFRLSEEAKRRISESRKGKPTTLGRIRPEAERRRLSEMRKGKWPWEMTPQILAKISAAMRNRKFSDRTRQRMSIAAKARVLRESRRGTNGQFTTKVNGSVGTER